MTGDRIVYTKLKKMRIFFPGLRFICIYIFETNLQSMLHKKLEAWKKAMDLSVEIFHITDRFPISERYGLSSQMRRCSVSVPSNISEGAARKSTKELIHFLYISLASLTELETQLLVSERLGFLKETDSVLFSEITQVRRLIQASIRNLKIKLNK